MKKIVLIFLAMFLLLSCNSKKSESKQKETKEVKVDKKTEQKQEENGMNEQEKRKLEVEKYNNYVNVYDYLVHIDSRIIQYYEVLGNEEKVKKIKRSFPTLILEQTTIDYLKKGLESKVKIEELDNSAKNLLPVLEELKLVADNLKSYYNGKDYLSDNYAKAQELHTKFLDVTKKYDSTSKVFMDALEKKEKEYRVQKIENLKNNGLLISYNLELYLQKNEKFLDEIKAQKLDVTNFTDGDVQKFKEIKDEIQKQLEEVEKLLGNSELLSKEKFGESHLRMFKDKTINLKATMATFINRMETKKKANANELSNNFFAEISEGTPENIFRVYNEMINRYNSLNSFRGR